MKKIKKNDEVIIIAGKDKGTVGRVLKIDWSKNRITVDKVNIVKKHQKPTQQNSEGGITEMEAPIHISNVALKAKGKEMKAIKVGFKIEDSRKKRINKATGKDI